MSRQSPYLSKPDEKWKEIREGLQSTTLFLMARNGPCVFTVRDESGASYRSILGNPNNCSCMLSSSGQTSMCIHILFCLLKVLKIKDNHPLCFQNSFVDSELDLLLNGALCEPQVKARTRKSKAKSSDNLTTNNLDGFATRQQVDDEGNDSCPICQDNMNKDQSLTWCRKGCGNNMHAKCMQTYCQYNISKKNEPQCPYCREPWLMDYLKQDCRGKDSLKYSCSSVSCSACTFGARGTFYRCIECSQSRAYESQATTSPRPATSTSDTETKKFRRPVDFCSSCFTRLGKTHSSSHHFVKSDSSAATVDDVVWTAVANPARNPMDLNLILSLQGRDITSNDYDSLLGLDNREILKPLPHHAVSALPLLSPGLESLQKNSNCWCEDHQQSSICDVDRPPKRCLPCNHVAHETCLLEVISTAGDDLVCLDKITCQHEGCGMCLLRGLSRRKKDKKKIIVNSSLSHKKSNIVAEDCAPMPVLGIKALGAPSIPSMGFSSSAVIVNGRSLRIGNAPEDSSIHPATTINQITQIVNQSSKLKKIRSLISKGTGLLPLIQRNSSADADNYQTLSLTSSRFAGLQVIESRSQTDARHVLAAQNNLNVLPMRDIGQGHDDLRIGIDSSYRKKNNDTSGRRVAGIASFKTNKQSNDHALTLPGLIMTSYRAIATSSSLRIEDNI